LPPVPKHQKPKATQPKIAAPVSNKAHRSHLAIVQHISEFGAYFLGNLPELKNDQVVDVQIEGHYRRKGRVVEIIPGGYRIDFLERNFDEPLPESAKDGILTLARIKVI